MKKYRLFNKFSGKSFFSDSLSDMLGLYYSLIRDYVLLNNTDQLNVVVHNFIVQVLENEEYVDYDYKTDF